MARPVDIAELTPHAGPMLLLDRIVDAGTNHFVSELTVRADGLFDSDGSVPSYIGLEYMAQTIAAFSGYQSKLRGEAAKPGVLLRTRRFNTNVSHFCCGRQLTVSVDREVQGESGLASFECRIEGCGINQTARLSVYEPPDAEKFMRGET